MCFCIFLGKRYQICLICTLTHSSPEPSTPAIYNYIQEVICFPSPRNSTALNVDVSHSDQWLMLDITKYFVSSPYVLSCWCGGGKRITTYTRHGLNARFGKSVMFFITLLTEGKKRGNYWSEKIKKKKKKIKSRTHPTSHIPFYAQQQKAEKSVRGVWGLLEQKYWPAVLPRSLPKKKKKKKLLPKQQCFKFLHWLLTLPDYDTRFVKKQKQTSAGFLGNGAS